MEELFNILSSSCRMDKSKRKKRINNNKTNHDEPEKPPEDQEDKASTSEEKQQGGMKSRDKRGKRDTSEAKLRQVHKEEIAAFRRSMSIHLANKNDPNVPDPISSFGEIQPPVWWTPRGGGQQDGEALFRGLHRAILRNIEGGKWKEPTPIQMQSIPTLLAKRDCLGSAPTGSGKSGAFILPSLFLSSAPQNIFYPQDCEQQGDGESSPSKKKKNKKKTGSAKKATREGEIRALLLAPSLELASQLHREVERLGMGKPAGLSSLLLSRSNAAHVIAGSAGGKTGLDILVSTPLRLVDSMEKGLRLDSVRIVVLDEADRLLDAADGSSSSSTTKSSTKKKRGKEAADDPKHEDDDSEEEEDDMKQPSSGSTQSKTFLHQMDAILSEIPSTATRALFSATITPTVRSLAESVLRNPVDITIASSGATRGGANPDIQQELMFVGREEGKLLAIRQLVQRGELRPPVLIFLQSQERAQALFAELLYDGIHVDVLHSGRSKANREAAVAKFRRGDTWVLICTDLVGRGVDFRAVNMVINYDLPTTGVSYVHRIGRTGRAGRKGRAITLFTEADFDQLRTIANVMKQSGCDVEEWMLKMPKNRGGGNRKKFTPRRRPRIDTTPAYDKAKKRQKQQMIQQSKQKKRKMTNEAHAGSTPASK